MLKFLQRLFTLTVSNELFVEMTREAMQYSPDMAYLEQFYEIPLFVCDELGPGCHMSDCLEGMRKINYTAFTQSPYVMIKRDLGYKSHPIVFDEDLGYQKWHPAHNIRGELWAVTPEFMKQLDREKENWVQYERRLVTVIIPLTEIFFKDRRLADNLFGRTKAGKRIAQAKRNGVVATEVRDRHNPVGSGLFKQKGVYRLDAWMYFGKTDYWGELIYGNRDKFPPVGTFRRETGPIREYYYFSDFEYLTQEERDVPF